MIGQLISVGQSRYQKTSAGNAFFTPHLWFKQQLSPSYLCYPTIQMTIGVQVLNKNKYRKIANIAAVGF